VPSILVLTLPSWLLDKRYIGLGFGQECLSWYLTFRLRACSRRDAFSDEAGLVLLTGPNMEDLMTLSGVEFLFCFRETLYKPSSIHPVNEMNERTVHT
jgi:hypothetical protein